MRVRGAAGGVGAALLLAGAAAVPAAAQPAVNAVSVAAPPDVVAGVRVAVPIAATVRPRVRVRPAGAPCAATPSAEPGGYLGVIQRGTRYLVLPTFPAPGPWTLCAWVPSAGAYAVAQADIAVRAPAFTVSVTPGAAGLRPFRPGRLSLAVRGEAPARAAFAWRPDDGTACATGADARETPLATLAVRPGPTRRGSVVVRPPAAGTYRVCWRITTGAGIEYAHGEALVTTRPARLPVLAAVAGRSASGVRGRVTANAPGRLVLRVQAGPLRRTVLSTVVVPGRGVPFAVALPAAATRVPAVVVAVLTRPDGARATLRLRLGRTA